MFSNRQNSRFDMRSRYGTEDVEGANTKRYLIALENACFACGKLYSSPGGTRNHIRNFHRYDIPARTKGERRPRDSHYDYVQSKDSFGYDELHFACPYCWFHCPVDELDKLYNHTEEQHDPLSNLTKDKEEDDMDISMNSSRRGSSSRSQSRQSRQSRRTSSRPSSRSSNRSNSSRQSDLSEDGYPSSPIGHNSGNLEHYPGSESNDSNSHHRLQGRTSSDREDTYSINEGERNELVQKLRELRDLFRDLFRD